MSHFAEIDDEGTVLRVIVAEQTFIDSGAVGDPSRWVQCSYNTREGAHGQGGQPLRKNFPGVGWKYDKDLDAFVNPKPHASWVLDPITGVHKPPIAHPNDGKLYRWDETTVAWQRIGRDRSGHKP